MRFRSTFLFLLLVVLAAPQLFAASLCGTGQTGSPLFCGDVWKLQAGGAQVLAPSGYRIDICDNAPCGATSYFAYTDSNGHWETQATVNGCQYGVNNKTWYIYIYSVEGWGAREFPVQTIYANSTCGLQRITSHVPPAPLRPQPISPVDNAWLYTPSTTLKWQNAVDDQRNDPNWPVTYDLYIKSWADPDPQPANYQYVIRVACAPLTTCSYPLTATSYPPYKDGYKYMWKVTATMDVTRSIVSPVYPPNLISTDGSYFLFQVGNSRCLGCPRF